MVGKNNRDYVHNSPEMIELRNVYDAAFNTPNNSFLNEDIADALANLDIDRIPGCEIEAKHQVARLTKLLDNQKRVLANAEIVREETARAVEKGDCWKCLGHGVILCVRCRGAGTCVMCGFTGIRGACDACHGGTIAGKVSNKKTIVCDDHDDDKEETESDDSYGSD
jgi:hypothetical protein